ncbi:MAG: hypothetical protein HDR12_06360 [Lachnospiraceae bacterium]|nr:hypothetical protein [Lachnospiraceae bacterium]
MENKEFICPDYCGVTCVSGFCPKALQDEYAERGYDVIRECEDCCYYKGCEDCAFKDSDLCIKNS